MMVDLPYFKSKGNTHIVLQKFIVERQMDSLTDTSRFIFKRFLIGDSALREKQKEEMNPKKYCKKFLVTKWEAGGIIGSGGKNHRSIIAKSGAKVEIYNVSHDKAKEEVYVFGTVNAVRAAVDMIKKYLITTQIQFD